jgi:hypothetical protein
VAGLWRNNVTALDRDSQKVPPTQYFVGQEIKWDAHWVDVYLRVELPFWLMMDNVTVPIEVSGHTFPVSVLGEMFELHGGCVSDSKQGVAYQGPYKNIEELSEEIQTALRENPDLAVLWRKCKTVLKIASRCNEDVLNRTSTRDENVRPAVHHALDLYLQELCRAHMPVVNKLIQGYRLATYDSP